MNNSDLAELRAQLQATGQDRRPSPRGPLGALRSLLGAEPPPLLGPPRPFPTRPAPAASERPPARSDADEPLLLDQPLHLPPRRQAFGQRLDASPEPAMRPASLVSQPLVEEEDMIAAIRRIRSPLALRIEEAIETPFLPEDLADSADARADRIYEEAGLAAGADETASPPLPSPAETLLLALEQRLLAEHMALIRILAHPGPQAPFMRG